jgi:uncharacterized protein YecT (DUF1311 family)
MKKIPLGLLFAAAAVFQAYSSPASDTANQPSFSCAAPSKIEAAICSDPALASRDRTMAALYAAARAGARGSGSSQEAAQKKWLKARNERCSKEDLRTCLAQVYDERLSALAVAALFRAPEPALTELSRQDSKSASLYQAIYKYATINAPDERIKAVEPLIAQAFKAVKTGDQAGPLDDVADAHTAASSDPNFAKFLDVASAGDYTLTLPCAALVQRPGLIDALDALYGGAIDGQLLSSDCDTALPPLPKLDELVSAAEGVQGTIRFSLGRGYEKTLVEIRLHRTDLWQAKALTGAAARFRAKHLAQINGATSDLAKYYVDAFAVSQQDAQVDAEHGVAAAVAGAFDLCESG